MWVSKYLILKWNNITFHHGNSWSLSNRHLNTMAKDILDDWFYHIYFMPLYIYNRVFFLLQYNKCICTKQSRKRYWCSNWKMLLSFHRTSKKKQESWWTSLQVKNMYLLTNVIEVSNFIKPVIFEARLCHWISNLSTANWVYTSSKSLG